MDIPKKIHYVWLGGKPLSEIELKYIQTWKEFLPDYEIIEWNEQNFNVNECDFCREAIKNKKWAFASDYIRLKVLYEYGGVYVDTDIEFIKNLDNVLKNNANSILGFENSGYLQTAIIITKPKMKWIKDLIDIYECSHFEIGKNKLDIVPNTFKLTAFLVKNYGFKIKNKEQLLKDDIMVMPKDFFAPKDYSTGNLDITENTITIHNYSGSWVKNCSARDKFLRSIRKIFGKKIFDWFTVLYTKQTIKKLNRKTEKILKNKG